MKRRIFQAEPEAPRGLHPGSGARGGRRPCRPWSAAGPLQRERAPESPRRRRLRRSQEPASGPGLPGWPRCWGSGPSGWAFGSWPDPSWRLRWVWRPQFPAASAALEVANSVHGRQLGFRGRRDADKGGDEVATKSSSFGPKEALR